MRHGKKTIKFGRKSQPRRLLFAGLVCNLIDNGMILTTLAKAKVTRPLADKMVTHAKNGSLHHRRQALAYLRQKDLVAKLFKELGPQHAERKGGYTRITKLGRRSSDAAEMAILEWMPSLSTTPVAPTEAVAQ
jgi:large subunit ribosomal protein L17